MVIKIFIMIIVSLIFVTAYILLSKNIITKISKVKAAIVSQSIQQYRPTMTFTAVSDYIDKLILDEYTLKYQMNIAMNGKYFLHDYDKDEVAHELEEFAGSILRLISDSMQREIEYYYNAEELERLIVRRCNMLLLNYVQQKKQEKAGKTIIRG